MTLNITVASRWVIYQSVDFRLSSEAAGRWTTTSDSAQKQVVLHYATWSGLLGYTGVAEYRGHNTEKWLSRILSHAPPDRSLDDVLRVLAREGNKWIGSVPLAHRAHTFTLAAFDAGRARIGWVSTVHRGGGLHSHPPASEFTVGSYKPRGPKVFLGGQVGSVTSEECLRLTDSLRRPDYGPNRGLLAAVNSAAARRVPGMVSEHCVAAHLLPDGSGEAQVFGDIESEFIPTLIMRGSNFAVHVPNAVKNAGRTKPHRLVGVTWTKNGDAGGMLGAFREIK